MAVLAGGPDELFNTAFSSQGEESAVEKSPESVQEFEALLDAPEESEDLTGEAADDLGEHFGVSEGEGSDDDSGDSEESEEVSEEDEAAAASEPDAEGKKGSRAQKRIRQLNEQKKAAEEERAHLQQQLTQMQQQMQLQQQYLHQQAEAQRQSVELQQRAYQEDNQRRLSQEERERYENMSVAEQIQYDAERRAEQRAQQLIEQRLAEVDQRLSQREQQEKQRYEEYQRELRLQQWTQKANDLGQQLGQRFVGEEVPEDAAIWLQEAILSTSAAFGEPMEVAAERFGKALEVLYDKKRKAESQRTLQKVNQSRTPIKGTSRTAPTGAIGQGKQKTPSKEQIYAAGYDSVFQWRMAGMPEV